ncbi:MAG: hypothetical protein HGB12_06350 [Bacteroidetes bacterium]|nr:hypothetical protein [Bacteroidota bacterium]
MKKIFSFIIAGAILLSLNTSCFAQKTKKTSQGAITYDIKYTGDNITPAQKAQLPTSLVVTVKDCKTKSEVIIGPVSQASITDGTTKTQIVLIDYMGTKYALKLTAQEISDALAKVTMPKLNITQETKVIAGYTCKKAILTSTDDEGTVSNDTIFFTEEIGCADVNFSTQFKEVPGSVLEYSEVDPQVNSKVIYTVKEIKKSKVSDNIFLIPSDYQEMTKEEFKKAFGGE